MKLSDLQPEELDEVIVFEVATGTTQMLSEGKLIDGRYKDNIRQDRNTHLLSGDAHYHIYGRRGDLVGVVKQDATISHNVERFRLHRKDADALRQLGVPIPASNIVEWIEIGLFKQFLME